jgi:hypothetical protein
MQTRHKIWLGVGVFVIAGVGASGAAGRAADGSAMDHDPPDLAGAAPTARSAFVLAQHHVPNADEGGEEGGERGTAALAPELAFAVRIALLRGHLLVGDELVVQQQWSAALPHFLHPGEEIYNDIRDQLADHRVPAFDASLATLSRIVKARKGGVDYDNAMTAVSKALTAADVAMKAKQQDWAGFTLRAAIETLKAAAGEYQAAIVGGKIAKPVEYQDARGFILQAERMIESVAPDLQGKDAAGFDRVRAGLAELKKVFPSPLPPRIPVRDQGAVLGEISRIELAAGGMM